MRGVLAQKQRDRRSPQRRLAPRRKPSPGHTAAHAEPVELLRAVVRDACGQHVVLPRGGRELETLELLDHRGEPFGALHLVLARDVLPVQEEAQEVGRAHRLDLGAQAVQRVAVDSREQAPVAPLEFGRSRREASAQDRPWLQEARTSSGISISSTGPSTSSRLARISTGSSSLRSWRARLRPA